MPVPKRSATQFAADVITAIEDRTVRYDTTLGAVPDAMVYPQARVFEAQNERLRKVSLVASLVNAHEYDDAEFEPDLDDLAFNEGMLRHTGGRSGVTAILSRPSPPPVDLPVAQGYPVGTATGTHARETVLWEPRIRSPPSRRSRTRAVPSKRAPTSPPCSTGPHP